jgi:hypothetical protein
MERSDTAKLWFSGSTCFNNGIGNMSISLPPTRRVHSVSIPYIQFAPSSDAESVLTHRSRRVQLCDLCRQFFLFRCRPSNICFSSSRLVSICVTYVVWGRYCTQADDHPIDLSQPTGTMVLEYSGVMIHTHTHTHACMTMNNID